MGQEHRCFNLRTAAIALAGLLVGGSNQVLALVLVRSDGTVHDLLTLYFGPFCLLWTAWTVVLNVLVGWNVTRCVQSSLCSQSRQQRTMLRRELLYVAGSVLGIWSTRIGMDVMHNRTQHMLPSITLLCASMTILHCLPGEPRVETYPTEVGYGGYVPPPMLLAVPAV
jgi:hypothetical protein